ncbi:MAG: methylated-DNA--[protein]-cysteine S-methyltransferase [Candidatus Omnitrophica bacterium]|nr:methylated-DNA--[protein]-cysteine S-methyltransferase [Candidatus Omnitrophota bacterium]
MEQEIFEQAVQTSWGVFTLIASEKGLRELRFSKLARRYTKKQLLNNDVHTPKKVQQVFTQTKRWLRTYLAGKPYPFDKIPIDSSSHTTMQARMLNRLARIPWGETQSYAWLAAACGIPKGFRAMGQLLKSNPLPILFPCHRVIRQDGSIGGFSQGIQWKKRLIAHESR